MMPGAAYWRLFREVDGRAPPVLQSTDAASGQAHPIPTTTIKMARRSRIAAWLVAAIFAIGLATFSSSARANVLDCLSDAAKIFDPSKLQNAAEVAKCGEYIANPTPTFAVTLAIVAAGMASNILPTGADECKTAIPDAAAKLILAAIESLKLPVPDALKEQLKSKVKGESQAAFNQILNDNPVLAAINDMFGCACVIAASAGDLLDDFADAANSCGAVIGDAVDIFLGLGGALVDGLLGTPGDVGKAFTCIFVSCPGSGTPGNLFPCAQAQCSLGQQCYPYDLATHKPKPYSEPADGGLFPQPANPNKDCGACSQVAHAVASAPGVCTCSGGFIPDYEKIETHTGKNKLLTSCDCPAPFSEYLDLTKGLNGWKCACPIGTKLINGKCDLICPPNQQPTAKQDLTKVIAGEVWSCEACPPNKTSDGHGSCKLHYCPPNMRVVTETKTDVLSSFLGEISKTTTTTESCEACPPGTKSDGEGLCISCEGENKFVANGACQSCKSWQQVKVGILPFTNSRCENSCPAGSILVDPNAPASASISSGPQSVKAVAPVGSGGSANAGGGSQTAKAITTLPGQGAKDLAVASPSVSAAPGAGAGAPKATAPDGLTSEPPSGQTISAKPVMAPMCVPCGQNEYVDNNQCHSCGPKAVVNKPSIAVSAPPTPGVMVSACTPCSGRQVAKLIDGAMVCAADCSSVGGGGKSRPSTNFITDPKNPSRCIACAAGMKPNDTRTACLGKAALSSKPVLTTPGADTVRKKKGSRDKAARKATSVKLICPPRTHPNASGTGCVPDLDMPGFDGPGVGPPAMGGRGGRAR